ncbi:MAG TPA: menaquinone biosynthesis protein [Lacipirellulaceae bacterium]|nr:menaquinone biosynthesis protein [Lacipirellulaceae bacterium]
MRIGAVNYLNSKPLVYGLDALAPSVRVTYDLPSRLADSLAAGRLDVALVPSVEFFRNPGCMIVSDACVACRGPVLSVKLHFRVPPVEVRRVALDEGSRTSAGLTRILLAEQYGVRPQWEALPIGCGVETTDADAVLLIGDRAIPRGEGGRGKAEGKPPSPCPLPEGVGREDVRFVEVWDLGERWTEWKGLPFVFAMWVGRPGVDVGEVSGVLGTARDEGRRHLAEIAAREAPLVGIASDLALQYLRDNLHFVLGAEERAGLRKFYELCVKHGLAPGGCDGAIWDAGKLGAYRR